MLQVTLAATAAAAAAETPGDAAELLALVQRLNYLGIGGHKKLFTTTLDADALAQLESADVGAAMQRSEWYGWAAGTARGPRRCRLLALLHYAPRVAALDVSFCELDSAAATALAASLKRMPQLSVRISSLQEGLAVMCSPRLSSS